MSQEEQLVIFWNIQREKIVSGVGGSAYNDNKMPVAHEESNERVSQNNLSELFSFPGRQTSKMF